ncbi:MAG: hypothetical protein JKY95_07845 [Planctomycetaceae bacterium]|nr:hypothetical protein [Planctomycetaceae bacterium]
MMAVLEDSEEQREQILETISHDFNLNLDLNKDLAEEAMAKTIQEQPALEQAQRQLEELLAEITEQQLTKFKRKQLSREATSLIDQSPEALDAVLNELGISQLEKTLEQLDSMKVSAAQEIVQLNDQQLEKRKQAAR